MNNIINLNWLIFGILVLILYASNYYITKIFKKKYTEITKLEEEKKELKHVNIKTLEQQLEYIKLKEKNNKVFGGGFSKFMFILLMFILFSIIVSYVDNIYKIILAFIYSIIIPYLYVVISKNKYKMYNYLSLFIMFIFFTGYIVIQSIDPLTFMDFRINILMLLPIFFLVNGIIKLVKGKIKQGVDQKRQ